MVQTVYKTLNDLEFIINLYDICIANSVICYKQCTIARYFDGNTVSHVEGKVNTKKLRR